MQDRVISIIEQFGYIGIALMITLETVFPPIPSEIILPVAGFTANRGDLSLLGVIIAATIGSVVGALILYVAARWFGRVRLYWLFERYGKYAMLTTKDLDRSFEVFDRYSNKAVMFGRCLPVVRSLISLPAGLADMRVITFIVFTAIGSAVWNTALIGAGYVLGSRWHVVEQYVGYLQWLVVFAVAFAAAWFVMHRLRQRRAGHSSGD